MAPAATASAFVLPYLRDPDGHRTELLLPGIQIIDIDDEPVPCPVKPGANSNLWGLPAPKSWVEEATNRRRRR